MVDFILICIGIALSIPFGNLIIKIINPEINTTENSLRSDIIKEFSKKD